jgi:hypothetical protein
LGILTVKIITWSVSRPSDAAAMPGYPILARGT